jgi:hypothetical protein
MQVNCDVLHLHVVIRYIEGPNAHVEDLKWWSTLVLLGVLEPLGNWWVRKKGPECIQKQ